MSYDDMYFEEEWEDRCRTCRRITEPADELLSCNFCESQIPSGRVHYRCQHCPNEWYIGRSSYQRNQTIVCDRCQTVSVGNCIACEQAVLGANAHQVEDLIVCSGCFSEECNFWCPHCARSFPYSGYLRFAFWGDQPGFHAAACVTHYRHDHIRSYDRACFNRHYARRIPGYDYELYRDEVNNRAKRQLIRAIARQVRDGGYPETAPVEAIEFVRAFERLQWNDEATRTLITKALEQIDGWSNRPRRRRRSNPPA